MVDSLPMAAMSNPLGMSCNSNSDCSKGGRGDFFFIYAEITVLEVP